MQALCVACIIDFNSHARVGRDRQSFGQLDELPDFNSHARVGRDP